MVLDASLLNSQHHKVWIKGKVEQSRERSSALYLYLSVVAFEKGAFRSALTLVTNYILKKINFYVILYVYSIPDIDHS